MWGIIPVEYLYIRENHVYMWAVRRKKKAKSEKRKEVKRLQMP